MINAVRDLAGVAAIILRLKRTRRTGWLDRGTPLESVESVADHSYATAMLAWLTALADPHLDADRVLQLAMIHDLAEAMTGDMPPYRAEDIPDARDLAARDAFFRVSRTRSNDRETAKRQAESEAFAAIARLLPEPSRNTIESLWREYAQRSTREARLVKQVDILETFLESRALANRFPNLPMAGFTDMAQKELTEPLFQAIRDAVLKDPSWPAS